jgi:xylulokinase
MDPHARGVIAGLTLTHTRGDIYRAALEATGFGVRHNIAAMSAAGGNIRRVVAVGGGTQGSLWPQIVSDVMGLKQERRRYSIGASYGDALLAAGLIGEPDADRWNPVETIITPNPAATTQYDALYSLYQRLYVDTVAVNHSLARRQRAVDSATASDTNPARVAGRPPTGVVNDHL